jgi:hypothetical protein
MVTVEFGTWKRLCTVQEDMSRPTSLLMHIALAKVLAQESPAPHCVSSPDESLRRFRLVLRFILQKFEPSWGLGSPGTSPTTHTRSQIPETV